MSLQRGWHLRQATRKLWAAPGGDQSFEKFSHLIPMGEMPTMGEIKSHDPLMWLQERRIHLEIGGGPRQWLHVHCDGHGKKKQRVLRSDSGRS